MDDETWKNSASAVSSEAILEDIQGFHPALLKLFAIPEYRLPDDVRSYYISDRRQPQASPRWGYKFDLFLHRATSMTWISLELDNKVMDRRSVKTFPLTSLRRVHSWQEFSSESGNAMGCKLTFDDGSEISLPLEDEGMEEHVPSPSRRAFDFGKHVHDAL